MTRISTRAATDPEDLSVRARQGSLSETERPALERAMAANPTLALAHQVGSDFDRIGQVRSGDDELVARLANLTLERARPRARFALGQRRLFLALAAALTMAGTAAAFYGAPLLRSGPPAPSLASSAPKQAGGARVTRAKAAEALAPSTVAAAAPEPPSTAVAAAAPQPSAVVAVLPAAPVAVALDSARLDPTQPRAAEDAATLFREAASARRNSDFGRARQLYLRLESEFPTSAEAQLARVSLGKVLLLMGRAGEAEQQFALYSSTGGTLSEEALVGQAQSLARLARANDEQKVWQRLLHDFPRSVYAAEANQRLAALSAASAR